MICTEVRALLPRIAEREGAPRVALETARHLAACRACAGELLRLRELSGLLERIPQADVPASFPTRVLRALRSKRGAGTLAILLSAAAGTGGSAIGLSATAGSVTPDPIQAAGTLLASVARALVAIASMLHASFDGTEGAAFSSTGSTGAGASSLIPLLGIIAALALAGAWTALGFSALNFHQERRRSD